jgi:hypothetical protein
VVTAVPLPVIVILVVFAVVSVVGAAGYLIDRGAERDEARRARRGKAEELTGLRAGGRESGDGS